MRAPCTARLAVRAPDSRGIVHGPLVLGLEQLQHAEYSQFILEQMPPTPRAAQMPPTPHAAQMPPTLHAAPPKQCSRQSHGAAP